ncbi:MAG: alpha/beta hydrolase [Pseudomonadota bacterium]
MTPASPEDLFFDLADGARLHARRYAAAGASKGVALCLPGLTRNERDFDGVAPIVARLGFDVIALSLRGRAKSSYANFTTYHPLQYRDDVLQVLDALGAERAIFIGTSLGGITTMLTAEKTPERVRAAIINDVGPELAPEGIARIMEYMAERPNAPTELTFDDAKAAIRGINDVAFPGADEAFWDAFTRRTFREVDGGKWRLDYDPGISRALAELGPAPDLAGGWAALAGAPTLLVRGAISDLLSTDIVERMRDARPGFDYVEAENVGHAPMLTEPEVVAAIDSFLAKI